MAILSKLREEELALVEIIRHPVLCPEFIRNIDLIPEEGPIDFEHSYYIHTPYQVLMLCDFNNYVCFCTARAIGKTESLIDKIIYYLLNNFWKDEYIVFLTPNRVHLDPVFRKLVTWFRTNELLKRLVGKNSINAGTFQIRLKTGAILDCRIAGTTGTGANVVGLHTPVIIIDEAAYFPWGTWQELQRCLNDWLENYQMIVAGVPDGRREKSVLYYVDQKDPLFTHHRIPAHMSPRWTEEAELRAREQFGGVNSEDYIHMVLGEHGSPVWSVFDRAAMRLESYDVFIKELWGFQLKEDSQAGYKQILEVPNLPAIAEQCLFGIDLGYTDPTAIIILYLSNERWFEHARFTWYQIPYDQQERLITYLDIKFNPGVIGIDEGSAGKAVIQHLLNDEKYKEHKFNDKLIPINFASTIPIGYDDEGKELRVRAKEFGVQYLQELTNTHRIVYSIRDEDLIIELERTTYTKSINGQMVFRTFTEKGSLRGSDHNLSALLAGTLALYTKNNILLPYEKAPKLFKPRWLFTK